MSIESSMKRKKGDPPKVVTLSEKTQEVYNWCGAYDMTDGSIHLGCDEAHTPSLIWHEVMHMVLFEQYSFESNIMWDNIANDLQYYLFNIKVQSRPHIYSMPTKRAIEKDGGAWREGKRKQKEKSITIGWKPTTQKRIMRTHEEIMMGIK